MWAPAVFINRAGPLFLAVRVFKDTCLPYESLADSLGPCLQTASSLDRPGCPAGALTMQSKSCVERSGVQVKHQHPPVALRSYSHFPAAFGAADGGCAYTWQSTTGWFQLCASLGTLPSRSPTTPCRLSRVLLQHPPCQRGACPYPRWETET